MRRIGILWDKKSMSEDVLKGVITILEGKTTTTMSKISSVLISVEVTKGTIHTKGMDGEYLPQLTDEDSELIYTMVKCYRAGLAKEQVVYHWVDL